MGKIIQFPGRKVPTQSELTIEVITDLMKEVAGVFIEQRVEQGPSEAWYHDIYHYVTKLPIPTENGNVEQASLVRWRYYWRNQALDYIRFYYKDV